MSIPVTMYLRTSSTTNLDGDSETRQQTAIVNYANKNDYKIVKSAYDQAVSGTDMALERLGFSALAEWCLDNSCNIILTESPSRFSRDVIVQEVSLLKLKEMGLTVIPVDSPDYYTGDSPSITMIRQILACVAGFERSSLVQKMKSARQRARKNSGKFTESGEGKCEGRKSLKEIYGIRKYNLLVKKATILHKEGLSYSKVAEALAKQGYVRPNSGTAFAPNQILKLMKIGEICH